MLCYALLCFGMLCQALLCYATPYLAGLCSAGFALMGFAVMALIELIASLCRLQTAPVSADCVLVCGATIACLLRAAKAAQRHLAAGGKLSDLPPPPPMDTSDYIQCPHCGRKFSDSAADRHIPKCKNIKSNKR